MASNRYQTRHQAAQPLAGHRHRQAYLALVDAGTYVEHSVDGTYRCEPGMAIVHPTWHLHSNRFFDSRIRVTNVDLAAASAYGVFRLSDVCYKKASEIGDPSVLLEHVLAEGRAVSAEEGPAPVQAMIEMLRHNPCQRIDEMARSMRLSPEHATRQFRRFTGMTPAAFRSEQRLRKALHDLRSGWRSLDVAHRWGYADQSHLCRAIKGATTRTITELQTSDLFNTDTIDHR
ncbi:MAG: helix-turn-helix transcriptional regulator [Gammaproteobacteria bacterium]